MQRVQFSFTDSILSMIWPSSLKRRCSRGLLIPLLAALLLPSAVSASPYLDELISSARQKNLATHDYWHRLLYYKQGRLPGTVRSETADPGFFLSPMGRHDPQAELEANLAAFFRLDQEPITNQPFQCRFIARYHWLKKQLDIDPLRLPPQRCDAFQTWYRGINPGQATLVFASDYLNNPSSMFGHTLLRFDPSGQGEDTRLLSYALNYAANANETSGLVFAVKGLTGGYPGRFSVMPYYEKVKEYNDWENRDLWEYQLTLQTDEIERLLMHAWELGPVSFDYYFLHENCSFRLLGLLEIARPGLQLTDGFKLWAIPTDTVRAVLAEQGLLKEVVYRPAASTVLQHQIDVVPDAVRDLAHDLALGDITVADPHLQQLSALEQAQAFEVAYAYLYYLFLGRNIDQEQARPRMRQLLVARSKVPISRERPQPPVPEVRPDEGHRTARIALAGGRLDQQPFGELRLRPAYHDLLDPAPGYKHGAQIDFLDLSFRHWTDTDNTQLEQLTLVDIFSLAPRDRFFRKTSWNAAVGFQRHHVKDEGRPLLFTVSGGGGYSYGLGDETLLYTLIKTELQASDRLPDNVRVGAGPQLGLLTGRGPLRVQLSGEMLWHSDVSSPQWVARLEPRLALGRQFALGGLLERRQDYGQEHDYFAISLHWYR